MAEISALTAADGGKEKTLDARLRTAGVTENGAWAVVVIRPPPFFQPHHT